MSETPFNCYLQQLLDAGLDPIDAELAAEILQQDDAIGIKYRTAAQQALIYDISSRMMGGAVLTFDALAVLTVEVDECRI